MTIWSDKGWNKEILPCCFHHKICWLCQEWAKITWQQINQLLSDSEARWEELSPLCSLTTYRGEMPVQAGTRAQFHCHCSSEGSPAHQCRGWVSDVWAQRVLQLYLAHVQLHKGHCHGSDVGQTLHVHPIIMGILGVNNQSCKNPFLLSENIKSLNSEQDITWI